MTSNRTAALCRGALCRGVLLVASAALLTACAHPTPAQPAAAAAPASGAPAPAAAPAVGLPADCQPYERTELFFGTGRAGKPPVSDQEFDAFLDAEITPRFPDGLTMLSGLGQWRGSDGKLTKERSSVVILLYPKPSAGDSGTKIEEIRHLYEQKFNQESVLRADDPEPRCVTF
ncbi:MAG TPA: DUF3574 domain-containing protein [Pseudonocardia sp.]|jgi:hypothetical protein|nr:DUF3574 domain-containing protein [Pseudonocardia sp.]